MAHCESCNNAKVGLERRYPDPECPGISCGHEAELAQLGEQNALNAKWAAERGAALTEARKELARLRATQEKAIYWLLRAYHSGHRQGWEEGPNVTETMNELHTFLCNQGYDPNLSAEAKKILQGPVQEMF